MSKRVWFAYATVLLFGMGSALAANMWWSAQYDSAKDLYQQAEAAKADDFPAAQRRRRGPARHKSLR